MKTLWIKIFFGLGLGHWLAGAAVAGNLLPAGELRTGNPYPAGWHPGDGQGHKVITDAQGAISLGVTGNGQDSAIWLSDTLALEPNALYRFRCQGRKSPETRDGSAVMGPERVNRDVSFTDAWQPYGFVFSQPSDQARARFRLGQWHVQGALEFRGISVNRVAAVHQQIKPGLWLGAGEWIRQGVYHCALDLNWEAANYHRALVENRAGFNSNRWLFSPGARVVYGHEVGGLSQTNAQITVSINYYDSGALEISASNNGTDWQFVETLTGAKRSATVSLPATLFPAPKIWIRLASAGAVVGFQVNVYQYQAGLNETGLEAEGRTLLADLSEESDRLKLTLSSLSGPNDQGAYVLHGSSTSTGPMEVAYGFRSGANAADFEPVSSVTLSPNRAQSFAIPLPPLRAGQNQLHFAARTPRGESLFQASFELRTGFLEDPHFGYRLPSSSALPAWWCESGWKVGRNRGLPVDSQVAPAMTISAARGEYEAAQLVLRPSRSCVVESLQTSPWKNPDGTTANIRTEICEVAYVRVNQPTDATGWRADFPDPLPPFRAPLALPAGQNQPFWISVFVPREVPGGQYQCLLTAKTSIGEWTVPIRLEVFDFALPAQTHLRSALGINPHSINQYHRLTNASEQALVYDKYLDNFARHRISPYSFAAYAPIDIRFSGSGPQKKAQLDFTRFDKAAEKWLSSGKFNSFQLSLRGMGGGTFHSRHLGELEGFKEGTPEHARLFRDYLSQIEAHLREKGWLDKAYTYWFDEPDPKDYEFVVAGMQRIKAAAPGIKRLLTEQPEPALQGHVEIWCGLTPEWSRETVKRRRDAGEEVWWYICTGPKAPYLTSFIDHPGTELRLWPWQSWQYGVTGILIWETTYWSSDLVFRPPQLQNPWQDPMSYVTGYGNPPGFIGYWGNGDGRFLYPPRRDPNRDREPNLEDPISSLRWEALRDGMEDYEYLWLLRERLKSASPAKRDQAEKLLAVPADISTDLTHFTTDPRIILQHRRQIALLLQELPAR